MRRLSTLFAAAILIAACQPSQEEKIAARVDDIVEFIVNKAGQTTGIIAHHGGEETRAPRK